MKFIANFVRKSITNLNFHANVSIETRYLKLHPYFVKSNKFMHIHQYTVSPSDNMIGTKISIVCPD